MPAAVGGLKVCNQCRLELPVSRFNSHRALRDGLNPRCKACIKSAADAYYTENREHVRDRSKWHVLKHRYGISREQYEELFLKQGGGCAVCGAATATSRARFLCVDHDHETGEIRGLLCTPCNLAIGYLKDDPELLAGAARYVTQRNTEGL